MRDRGVGPAITHDVTLHCEDGRGRSGDVEAGLTYDPLDPFAITVVFWVEARPVPWTFARDLLARGTNEPAGLGDVHVWPALDGQGAAITVLELQSDEGAFTAQARTGEVRSFLRRSYDLVPAGAETAQIDLDAELAELLEP